MKKIIPLLGLLCVVLASCQTVVISLNKNAISKSIDNNQIIEPCNISYTIRGRSKSFSLPRRQRDFYNTMKVNKDEIPLIIKFAFDTQLGVNSKIDTNKSQQDRFRVKNIQLIKTTGAMGCLRMGASCLSFLTINLVPLYNTYEIRTVLIDVQSGKKYITRDRVIWIEGAGIYLTSALGITQKIPNEEGWSWLGVVLYNQLSTLLASLK